MPTTGIVLTESKHPGAFMVSESPGRFSRDAVTIAQNQTVVPGQVLGKSTAGLGAFAAAAAAAVGGNTGNGTVSAPTTGAGVMVGTYTLRALAATVFEVVNPLGDVVGEARTGVAFAGQIGFTITAGGTAFVAGDQFTTAVTETDPTDAGQWKALNLAATDGSQNAAGISWGSYTTGAGVTMLGTVITRDVEVRGVDLVYPAGATQNQIAAINAQLGAPALNIIVR